MSVGVKTISVAGEETTSQKAKPYVTSCRVKVGGRIGKMEAAADLMTVGRTKSQPFNRSLTSMASLKMMCDLSLTPSFCAC